MWEYRLAVFGTRSLTPEALKNLLTEMGSDNWELVGFGPLEQTLGTIISYQYIFKRPKK